MIDELILYGKYQNIYNWYALKIEYCKILFDTTVGYMITFHSLIKNSRVMNFLLLFRRIC